ncbi:recombinase RecA [Halosegnis sp.]|uniref:DUF7504 family protein n=1 Tax=Halosegnis sp. TaxID=2864959 RepID=UPI0035D4D3C3
MTDKRGLVFELLSGSPDQSAVVATTKADAARVRREFPGDNWSLSVVDCVSQGGFGSAREDDVTRYVSTPADLTGLGIALSGFMQDCYHDSTRRRTRVGIHSLSTLLMYADIRRVYQFVHTLTTRVQSAGFAGAFALDTSAGDSETRERLLQLFDAAVETRETDATTQLRVRGGDFGPRPWTEYNP